ncbi:unnamed protein product [Strongylus vulgaris]|uniref:BTB domain-containing protein n=1 Tax=Strongylus vulgaris TaxID=40348 RepID=A0A3P7KMV5_STRVU|nr:unnamed protein product [Strongylus vulgaris]
MSTKNDPLLFREAVEWQQDASNCHEVPDTAADRYVRINVGGALFQTTIATLTKHDTMLRAMFSGRMQVVTDSDGWVLIDRSGRHFGVILDFLRDGFVPLPDCRVEVEQILAEARYYLVQDLAAECQSWLEALRARRDVREPTATCSIPVVHTKAEADRLVLNSVKASFQ